MPCGVTFRLNPERASRTRNSKPMAGCPQAIICANPEKKCFFFLVAAKAEQTAKNPGDA